MRAPATVRARQSGLLGVVNALTNGNRMNGIQMAPASPRPPRGPCLQRSSATRERSERSSANREYTALNRENRLLTPPLLAAGAGTGSSGTRRSPSRSPEYGGWRHRTGNRGDADRTRTAG